MIPAASGINFRFVDIPWFPNEFRIMTPISPSRITANLIKNLKSAKLRDWKGLVHHTLVDEFGDYVFSHMASAGETDNFFWQRPLTAEEKLEPFLVEWESSVHPWPPYLEDLKFVKDRVNGRAVEREAFHDGVSVACDIEVSWYVSDAPFAREEIATDEPIPGPVSWDFYTTKGPVSGRFPDCLHGRVVVPTRGDPNLEIIDAMPDNVATFNTTRTFEPTNHTRWRPHVFSNKPTRDEAYYVREQRRVYPPLCSRSIKL